MTLKPVSHAALGPADLFALQFIRDARLSPDGQQVAYCISRTDHQEHFEIWVMDAHGLDRRPLPYSGNAQAPRWSPDGRWIAFNADGQLRLASLADRSISDPLTPRDLVIDGAASWAPDSARLAVSLTERRIRKGPQRVTTRLFRADGLGLVDQLSQGIYEVNSRTRALRRLTPEDTLCSQPQWSPCGRRVLFFATDEAIPFASYSPQLFVVTVDDTEVRNLLGPEWFISSVRWLPDGNSIVVAGARDSTLTVPTLSLWVVNVSTRRAERRLPESLAANVGCRMHHDMPAWDLTANMFTVLDQQTALVSVQKGGAVEIWSVGLEGEMRTNTLLRGPRCCIALDVVSTVGRLLFAVSSLESPTELWSLSLEQREEKRLTFLNDAVLSRWPAIHVERFTFNSSDGLKIDAWYLASEHRSPPLPTILFIHGGPFIATGDAFRFDFLLLAAQGFGVMFANFRGSAGYGEPFARAIMGDYGQRGYPDHMGIVNEAIARGFADPDRLGVWGASHGGFATCWIVGQTNRFKAAVAEAAVTNFTTTYYLSDAPDGIVRDLGGRPDQIPDIYRSRSPITYAHRCTTPTLLLHGEDDLRCPIAEAEQFYRVLQDVGCTTELYRIPECSHLGDSSGPVSARLAQNEALVDWFQRHL